MIEIDSMVKGSTEDSILVRRAAFEHLIVSLTLDRTQTYIRGSIIPRLAEILGIDQTEARKWLSEVMSRLAAHETV